MILFVAGLLVAQASADEPAAPAPVARADDVAAFDALYPAAAAFDLDAMMALAEHFERGRGVPRDPLAAAILYRMAEALGRPAALARFEALVAEIAGGLRPAERLPHLIEVFNRRLAANLPLIRVQAVAGNPNAQFVYGALLAEGIGVAKDPQAGYEWLSIARPALIGPVVADHVAESLAHLQPEVDVAAARRRVAAFRSRPVYGALDGAVFADATRPGFFDDNGDPVAVAARLLRAVILPMIQQVLNEPQFRAHFLDGRTLDLGGFELVFAGEPTAFDRASLHHGYAARISIPASFLAVVDNVNSATIATALETNCPFGIVAGETLAACDQPERLSSFLRLLFETARNDLRRDGADLIAPHVRLAGVAPDGTLGTGANPAAYRGSNLASALAVLVAHQIGHYVIGNATGSDDTAVESRIADFTLTLLARSEGGLRQFPLAGIRSAYLALNIGRGDGERTYVCQTQVAAAQMAPRLDPAPGDQGDDCLR